MKMSFVKNALAALTLIGGAMFASCSEEDLDTTFEPGAAQVQISVNVYNALTGEEVSNLATIDLSDAAYRPLVGTTYPTYSKEYANGVDAGTTVNVKATLGTLTKTEQVTITTAVKKGGSADYHVNIILTGDEYVMEKNVDHIGIDPYYPSAYNGVYGHGVVSHDGSLWFENATEYFMPVSITVTYPVVAKVQYSYGDMDALGEDVCDALDAMFEKMEHRWTATKFYTYTASAWSLSTPTYKATTKTTSYNYVSKATGKVVYTATILEYYTDFTINFENDNLANEIPHPSHASHYAIGHGHAAHGDSNNAGGGIVVAD